MSKPMKKPRILVTSSSQEAAVSLRSILPRTEYSDILYTKSLSLAQNRIQLGGIDLFVLIPMFSDDCSLDVIKHLASRNDLAVLLIVKPDISEQLIYQLQNTGIAVLTMPINKNVLRQTLSLLVSMLTRLQLIENENARLRRQLNSMRIMNQAKLLLMEHQQLTEDDAHHYVEKYSMEHCISVQEAAEEIIASMHFQS